MTEINVVASRSVIIRDDEAVLVAGTPKLLFYSKADPELLMRHVAMDTIPAALPGGHTGAASALSASEDTEVRYVAQTLIPGEVMVTYAVIRK